mgnify:CR=1 FL=1
MISDILSIYKQPFKIMVTLNNWFYGELLLDDCNVYEFEFPLSKADYEDAVAEQIAGFEAEQELQFERQFWG